MRRLVTYRAVAAAICAVATLTAMSQVRAASSPIDLNDFFADPAVTVSADGTMATLGEDEFANPVVLVNDPFLGDAEVVVAAPGRSLVFAYAFAEGPGNDDEFTAILFDASPAGGPVFGELAVFVAATTASGTVSFDLSAHTGKTLGLYFELFDLSLAGLESTVTIADLRLVDAVVIPVPAGLYLLASALVVLLRRQRAPA